MFLTESIFNEHCVYNPKLIKIEKILQKHKNEYD